MRTILALGMLALVLTPSNASAQSCDAGPVAVQILGSGGPAINRFRSSTSYLLRVDNEAKVLIDMGGGAFGRFGQSDAKLSDLAMGIWPHL